LSVIFGFSEVIQGCSVVVLTFFSRIGGFPNVILPGSGVIHYLRRFKRRRASGLPTLPSSIAERIKR